MFEKFLAINTSSFIQISLISNKLWPKFEKTNFGNFDLVWGFAILSKGFDKLSLKNYTYIYTHKKEKN